MQPGPAPLPISASSGADLLSLLKGTASPSGSGAMPGELVQRYSLTELRRIGSLPQCHQRPDSLHAAVDRSIPPRRGQTGADRRGPEGPGAAARRGPAHSYGGFGKGAAKPAVPAFGSGGMKDKDKAGEGEEGDVEGENGTLGHDHLGDSGEPVSFSQGGEGSEGRDHGGDGDGRRDHHAPPGREENEEEREKAEAIRKRRQAERDRRARLEREREEGRPTRDSGAFLPNQKPAAAGRGKDREESEPSPPAEGDRPGRDRERRPDRDRDRDSGMAQWNGHHGEDRYRERERDRHEYGGGGYRGGYHEGRHRGDRRDREDLWDMPDVGDGGSNGGLPHANSLPGVGGLNAFTLGDLGGEEEKRRIAEEVKQSGGMKDDDLAGALLREKQEKEEQERLKREKEREAKREEAALFADGDGDGDAIFVDDEEEDHSFAAQSRFSKWTQQQRQQHQQEREREKAAAAAGLFPSPGSSGIPGMPAGAVVNSPNRPVPPLLGNPGPPPPRPPPQVAVPSPHSGPSSGSPHGARPMIGQTSPSGFLPLAPPQQLNAGMPGHPPLPAPAPRQPPQPQNTPTNALHPHLPSPLQSQPGQTAAPGSDLTKFFPNLAPTPTGESAHRKLEESFPIQTSQPPPRGLLTPGSAALRQATASGEMANGVRRPVPQPQGMHQPQQQATAMAQAQAGGAQSQSTEGRKGGMAIMAMLGLEGQQHQGPPHRSQTPSHAAAPSRDPDGPTPRHLQSQQSADGGGMKISVAELFAMGGGGGAGQATPPQTTTASTPHAQPHAIGGAALPSQRVGTQPVSGYGGAAMQGHQATATPTAASRPAAALSQQIPTSEAEALYRQRLQQQQMLAGVAGLQAGVRASPSQPGVPGTSPAGVPQSVGLSGQQAQQVQRQMATTQQQPGGIFGHTAAPVTSSSSSSSASAAAAGSGSAPQAQTGLPVQLVQAAIAGGKLSSQGAQQIPAKVAVPPLVQKPPPSSAAVAPPAGTSLQQQQQQAAMAQLQTQTQQGQQDLIGLSSFGQLRGGNPPERQRTDGSASIFSNQTGGSLFRSAPPPPPAGQPSAVSATPTGSQQPQAAAASTPSHQQQWPLSGQQRASTGTVPAAPPGAPPTQTLQATQSYPATAGAGGARSQGPLPSPPQKSPAGGLGLWPQSPESLLSGGPSSSLVNVPLPPPGQPGDHGTAAGGLSASQRRPQGEGVWGSLHQQQQTGSASASTSSSVAAAAQAAARVQAASAAAGTGTAAWGAGATSSSSIWPSQQQQQQPGGLAQQQGTMGGLRSSTGVSGGQSIFGGAPKQPAPAATQPRGPAQLTSQLFPSGSASATAAGARMGASWSEMSPQGQARTTTGVAPPPPSFPITSQQQQQKAAGGLLNLGAPQGGHLSSGYGGASLQQQPQAPAAKAVNDWERGDRKISDSKIAELFSTAQRVQSQVTPGASQGVGGVLGGSRPGQGGSLSGPGLGGGMGTIGGQVPPLVGTTPSGGEALAASRQTSSSSGTFRAPPPAPGGGSSGGGLAGLGGSLGMGLRSVGGGVQMPLSGIVGGESSVKLGLHGQAAGGGGGMLAGLHGQAQGHAPPPQQQHHKIDQEWLALYK